MPPTLTRTSRCFPSRPAASGDQDGLPVAMLEAMGSGLAVIASDLPGLNEAIVDGVSGLLVRAGRPASLGHRSRCARRRPGPASGTGRGRKGEGGRLLGPAVGAGYRALLREVCTGR